MIFYTTGISRLKIFRVVTLLLILTIVATKTLAQSKEGLKSYPVKKITGTPLLSGSGDDALWRRAHILSDFHYPWGKGAPPPTRFKALHNNEWLYILFEVEDPDVFIMKEKDHKSEVAGSSRVEIFFKRDDLMNPYYCLEIDPLGRVLDYEGTFHRKFNLDWSWPAAQLIIKTRQRIEGYSVEFAISKSSLESLGLLGNKTLQAGLYRADCALNTEGNSQFRWISWVKPSSETPDFHIPSSFGLLRLED